MNQGIEKSVRIFQELFSTTFLTLSRINAIKQWHDITLRHTSKENHIGLLMLILVALLVSSPHYY